MKRFIFTFFITFIANFNSFGQYYFYDFGRNKVQYDHFEWHILKTEHFDIYYYPEMKDIAERGAHFAEESYKVLQDKFNNDVSNRIPLIFYSSHFHFQQTNVTPGLIPEGVGGFFEFLKGRVVIPSDGSISQFKRVIRHELVHVFMHTKINRVLKDHRKLNSYVGPPLWFVEGLAEYWSQDFLYGGNTHQDSQSEMVIKDAVLNNYIVPLSRLYEIYGTYLMYKEGESLCQFIGEVYGEEKILLLMENIWKEDEFSKVMEITVGKTYKDIDEEWVYYLKKKYYPVLKDTDSPRMVTIRITDKGFNSKPAYYNDNGIAKVVYVGNHTGYSEIYLQDLKPYDEKIKKKTLIKGERNEDFEAFHLLSSKIDVSKTGRLAFSTKSGKQDVLYIYDIPSEKIISKFEFDEIVGVTSPSWSPDESSVVFSGLNFSGNNDLYIINVKERTLQKLTNDFYDDRDPAWSPDGNFIAFGSDRTTYGKNGKYNIFVYELSTGKINYVTAGNYNDRSPTWSNDKKFLAFTSDRNGATNIWVMEYKGNSQNLISPDGIFNYNLKQITSLTTAAFDPEWTYDNELLFSAFENFNFQIRMISGIDSLFKKAQYVEEKITILDNRWESEKIIGEAQKNVIKYEKKYSLDIAQTQLSQDPILGTAGGGQVILTDMLGNDQYYFLLYNNAQSSSEFLKRFNFAVTKFSLQKRTNYGYGLYRFSGQFYTFQDSFFEEERWGTFFVMSYPFSTFQRIEASVNVAYSVKDLYTYPRRPRHAYLVSDYVSYIRDTSLWGPTGPIDGNRINLTLGYTVDVKFSNVNYYTIIADYRKYFRLSTRMAYAVRLMTQYNEGKEARLFYFGGSWDIRGYKLWSLVGKKAVLVNNEFRFPFIDTFDIRFPFLTMSFNAIRGAIFFDAGNIWNSKWGGEKFTIGESGIEDFSKSSGFIGSFGAGVRLNIGGPLVLRLDFGRRTNFRTISKENFTQFFFGWDF